VFRKGRLVPRLLSQRRSGMPPTRICHSTLPLATSTVQGTHMPPGEFLHDTLREVEKSGIRRNKGLRAQSRHQAGLRHTLSPVCQIPSNRPRRLLDFLCFWTSAGGPAVWLCNCSAAAGRRWSLSTAQECFYTAAGCWESEPNDSGNLWTEGLPELAIIPRLVPKRFA